MNPGKESDNSDKPGKGNEKIINRVKRVTTAISPIKAMIKQ